MKYTLFTFAVAIVSSVLAAPTSIEKRTNASSYGSTSYHDDPCPVGYGTMNGGTTGGAGGNIITVSDLASLESAAADDIPKIIFVEGTITGNAGVRVGSNKSIIGKTGSCLEGVGFLVAKKQNVILRNLKISKVLAAAGDAIGIQYSDNVWVDHCDLSSELQYGKDYYDGLLDITHGCDYITVSNTYFHDHWKASLVGHSDANGYEDKSHLTVTFMNNYFKHVNSRTPSFRFGTGHIYNNYFESLLESGIDTRDGAQLYVQNNVFVDTKKPLFCTDGGYATVSGNDFGGAPNTAPTGKFLNVPYSFTLQKTSETKDYVVANAGAILSF